MSSTQPQPTTRHPTPRYLRIVFGLAAVGLTFQWLDRLGRVMAGEPAGWRLAWDIAALCFLPLGVMYFAARAVAPDPGAAEPGAAPDPAAHGGSGSS